MLKLNRKALIEALRFLTPIFAQKGNKFESLKGVLISLSAEAMRITSCDLETTASLLIPVSWEGEVKLADAVLNGKALLALLRSLAGEGLRVEGIPGDRPGIRIIDESGSTAEVPGVCDPEAFPGHPKAECERVATINSVDLARMMTQGCVSAGDGSRFSVAGVKAVLKPGGIDVVSTDGHRLSVAHAEAEIATPKELLITKPAVELLGGLTGNALVEIFASPEYARFTATGKEITTKLLEQSFPEVDSILSRVYKTHITVDRGALTIALKRSACGRTQKPCSTWTLDLEHGDLTVAGESGAGTVSSHLAARGSGPGLKIGVQPVQILEFLATCTTETVVAEFDAAEFQFKLSIPGAQMIAMPVRI